jgi:hypothetical protein
MTTATEVSFKAAVTVLLAAVFLFDRPPFAVGNGLRGLAVAVVAALGLYITTRKRQPTGGPGGRRVLAYSLTIAALLGILGGAIAFR